MGTARYLEIAETLRQAILGGELPVGGRLPSESALMTRWGASRGTVRQAVALLGSEGLVGSRQGARRIVLSRERRHSFAELNSFAQWARGLGLAVTGRILARSRRPATPEEAEGLGVTEGTEVLYVLRVRNLDGEPTMLERTAYAAWAAPAVEALAEDCVSIMDSLARDAGIVAQYGEHLIDAVAAGGMDARLLGVRRGSPLLRQRHVSRDQGGRAIEWSDDRYRPGSVTFSTSNSATAAPLGRRIGDRAV
ncbi:GntR family transcriptional regulator [Streptomyces sp. C10-9-1]|uniref:GntR family transcriptional regulator n=1 Tax=Streptomyces sp. C10-9-1 TaxID=1859285 RepID=UPI00211250CC|nr:GntR family transcriptional regulator [Streptomyces sp. C10-9-1]MCQ6554831.1 GntR family transcriptional regulator [Streptomyces sp. C10-9-1]